MIFNSRQEVLEALRHAAKGKERQEILNIKNNRDFIKNSGANVTLTSGKIRNGKTIKEQIQNIHVGLITRLNAKTRKPDGIGALGGLAERTSEEEFAALSENQRRKLINVKDDIIIKNNRVMLTNDINIIRINNVMRETREELENLGISNYHLPGSKIKLIDMPEVRDDNYAVNIWNGSGCVWAITPYCHTLECPPQTLRLLARHSQNIQNHQKNSEAAEFIVLPLFEALKRFGNYQGSICLEDGRNAQTDYRYPHEWLAAWHIVATALRHDNKKINQLINELQEETPWQIGFRMAAEKMGKDLNFITDMLKVSPDIFEKTEYKCSSAEMPVLKAENRLLQAQHKNNNGSLDI